TRLVAKSARSAAGLEGTRASSSVLRTIPLPLTRAFRAAAAVAAVGLVPTAAECGRARGLRLCGWRWVSAGLFVAPVLTFASALILARLFVCLAGLAVLQILI